MDVDGQHSTRPHSDEGGWAHFDGIPEPIGRSNVVPTDIMSSSAIDAGHVDSPPADPEARLSGVPCGATTAGISPSVVGNTSNPMPPHARDPLAAAAMLSSFDLGALRTRLLTMMLGTGERPMASGLDAVATAGTFGLVVAVRDVVSKLWATQRDDIIAACAPQLIDEIDVLAYLMADALGRPLLHPDDTNAVGKRIASCALRVTPSTPSSSSMRMWHGGSIAYAACMVGAAGRRESPA